MDINLTGAAGRIQASYHKSNVAGAPMAVIFHDIPQNGGNMNEQVAYTLFYSFVQKGFNVIRFNFRGIGNTQGTFENGEAELADASTVVDWIQEQNEDSSEFWLAGVGFGAWVAMQILMRRIEITGFIAVSPQLKKYDFSFFNPVPCDGLLIESEAEHLVLENIIKSFVNNVNKQKTAKLDCEIIKDANSKYNRKLKELFTIITNYLGKKLP
ncbi:alpha/beta hydrolase [bacterium]|nr:alpha/beta hydrolase [bacterium]